MFTPESLSLHPLSPTSPFRNHWKPMVSSEDSEFGSSALSTPDVANADPNYTASGNVIQSLRLHFATAFCKHPSSAKRIQHEGSIHVTISTLLTRSRSPPLKYSNSRHRA